MLGSSIMDLLDQFDPRKKNLAYPRPLYSLTLGLLQPHLKPPLLRTPLTWGFTLHKKAFKSHQKPQNDNQTQVEE